MRYRIRDIQKGQELTYKEIGDLEEIVMASMDAERVRKVFTNQDDTYKIDVVADDDMIRTGERVTVDSLIEILETAEQVGCEIDVEIGTFADSYKITGDFGMFPFGRKMYHSAVIVPLFNEKDEMLVYVVEKQEVAK